MDPTGNLLDGVVYWTGSGNDGITIDGTHSRLATGKRTTTILNTGLGNDTVNVNLQAGVDDFFVLNTAGGSKTHDPLPITNVAVEVAPDHKLPGLVVTATVKVIGKTGVEMEALTAASVACLTIYDMAKAIERGMRIENIHLVEKLGGKSGHYRAAKE